MRSFSILLFDGFETLDAFGPAEIIGKLSNAYMLEYYSCMGGMITSSQNIRVDTKPLADMPPGGVFLIPGGMGTRALVHDEEFLCALTAAAKQASCVLTVCTGSALLAKTGMLDGRRATSNKRAFDWVTSVNGNVQWVGKARWVKDGDIYTSSGVSAGMDMTLGFVRDQHGRDTALATANGIEYIWNEDMDNDPFAV